MLFRSPVHTSAPAYTHQPGAHASARRTSITLAHMHQPGAHTLAWRIRITGLKLPSSCSKAALHMRDGARLQRWGRGMGPVHKGPKPQTH